MLPELMTRVASPDRDEALAGLDEVRELVWKDGALGESAPQAVSFLVALAAEPAVLVRPPVLQLLAMLFSADPSSPSAEPTRRAVRARLHDFLGLLGDEDRDVRVAAACLVTGFHDRDAEVDVRRALGRRFGEEGDEIVRANLIGCLNIYLPSSHLELYDQALERDPSLLVRREAAHSLAAVKREETPTLAVATLIEAMLRAGELTPLYAGVAWNRRGIVADSCWALTRLGDAARPYLRHLEKLLRRASAQDALAIGEAALLIAFAGPASSRSRDELGPEQLSLLRVLAETDAIWGQELPQMLAHYGLPRDQARLLAFVLRS